MGRILYGIIAAIASFMLAESLTCNKCKFGLVGLCVIGSEETCSTNTSVCYTGKAVFPNVSSYVGFNTQGCREPDGCNATLTGTLLGAPYEVKTSCCSTDKCNPVEASGAPSVQLSVTATIGAAILASMWSNMLS